MQTKLLKLDEIIPYEGNARDNEATVAELEKSLDRFGYNVPLVVDESNVIITGHARYQALQNLGYEEVLCVVSDLDTDLTREYRIIDNKISEISEWDTDKLTLELRGLEGLDAVTEGFGDKAEKAVESSFGGGLKPVTEEDIEKTSAKLDNIFEERASARNDNLVPIECPYCEEGFSVDRGDLE